jgi:hypothetical protein
LKVLAYPKGDRLGASCFVLSRVDPAATIDLSKFATYQGTLADLEERTRLDLCAVRRPRVGHPSPGTCARRRATRRHRQVSSTCFGRLDWVAGRGMMEAPDGGAHRDRDIGFSRALPHP